MLAAERGKKVEGNPCRSLQSPGALLEAVVEQLHRPAIEHEDAGDKRAALIAMTAEHDPLVCEVPADHPHATSLRIGQTVRLEAGTCGTGLRPFLATMLCHSSPGK